MKSENQLKNEKGSALAYVLIFGMVILILVLGLLTVANSGITFTQQSVESRQAYMDAKSVIEFGKIEINERGAWLNVENGVLEELYQELEAAVAADESTTAIQSQIEAQKQKIADYMTSSYYIGGTAGQLLTTIQKIDDESSALGVMTVEPQAYTDESTGEIKTNYIFDIKTQNLRRTLDYQTNLYYTVPEYTEASSGGGGSVIEPTDNSTDWLDTQIEKKSKYQELKCVIQKNGNKNYDSENKILTVDEPDLSLNVGKDKSNANEHNTKFGWWQECKLDMNVKNVCFTAPFPSDTSSVWKAEFNVTAAEQIRIKEDYVQNNNDSQIINNFKADNIVFEGDLILNNNANLKIECKNLWVKGDIKIDSQGGTKSTLDIEAENIYVGDYENNSGGNVDVADRSQLNWDCSNNILIRGNLNLLTNSDSPENHLSAKNISIGTDSNSVDLTVKNKTRVIWDCENFWLHGNMTTITSGSYQEFNNIVYFQAGEINLSNQCTIKINGKEHSTNQIFVDGIIPKESNNYTLEIKNFELLQCNGGLGLTDNSKMDLEVDNILIKGDVLFSFTGDIVIKTDYLDIQGKTTVNRAYKEFLIEGLSNMNIRFAGGYEQTNSTVTIKNSGKTIFSGDRFKFGGDGVNSAKCNIFSDMVYIDADAIDFKQYWAAQTVGFNYHSKNGTPATNLSIKNKIDWKPENTTYTVLSGKYEGVGGAFPSGKDGKMLYELTPASYQAPLWSELSISFLSPPEPTTSGSGSGSSGGSGSGSGGTVSGGFISNGSEKYY